MMNLIMWQLIAEKSKWMALFFLSLCIIASTISVSATTIVYILAFLFVLMSGHWREIYTRMIGNQAALSFLLLLSLFIVGAFYSTSTKHLMMQDLHKRHWMLMTPIFIAFITEEKWRARMINIFFGAMIIILALSYVKYFLHFDFAGRLGVFRTQEPACVFQDHIVQSFAMNIAAFICGYRVLFQEKNRAFYAIIFILMMVDIIFMTHGRTGYATFILLLGYLCGVRFGLKGAVCAGLIGVLLMGSAFIFSSNFQMRTKNMVAHYENYSQIHVQTSIGQRIEMWHIAKKMIKERPWFGYGTGGIQTALQTVVPANERVFNPSIDYVESIYLNFLLQFGVFGLAVLFIALSMQIKTTLALPHGYRCLMQAVLIAVLFGGLFNGFFVSFPISHFYALFSALCFSALPWRVSK